MSTKLHFREHVVKMCLFIKVISQTPFFIRLPTFAISATFH